MLGFLRMKPFYRSTQWKKLSLQHRKKDPLCVLCSERNQFSKAQCVDHISGIRNKEGRFDRNLAFDRNNLRSLCFQCHNQVTFSATSDQYIERAKQN